MLKITDVRIYPYNGDGNLKAFAALTFEDCFVVSGLKVMSGKKGLFVSMPAAETKNGEWKDTAYPLSADFREKISDEVLTAYDAKLAEEEPKSSRRSRR